MKRHWLLPFLVAAIAILAVSASPQFLTGFLSPRRLPGLRTGPSVILGSHDSPSKTGYHNWLIPADTLIATSYTAGKPFDQYQMNAEVAVLYNATEYLRPGTVSVFGLYINDRLAKTDSCRTDLINGSGGWTAYGAWTVNGSVSWSNMECGVSLFETPYPAGTVLTITVWASQPLWMQVDASPTSRSYELTSTTLPVPPSIVYPSSGTEAPYTITAFSGSD